MAINLYDVTKNSKEVQRGLKEWDRANDAEIVECLERRGEVKHLKAKSYDRVRTVLRTAKVIEHDADSGHGFTKGDRVTMTPEGIFNAALCGDKPEGYVQGIRGAFVKVNGAYYAPNRWRKA